MSLPAAGAQTRATASVARAAAAPLGPQLVQTTGATETKAATALTATFPASTASGHLLVLAASVFTGTTNRITSVTDSAGRSWTRIGTYAASGHNSDGELWYSANAPAVTSVTARTKSSSVMAISVLEFSGVLATSPLDAATGASASSTKPSSGPATATGADLAVGFIAGHASSQAITVTAPGYTAQAQRTSKASSVSSVITASRVLDARGSQTFTGSQPAAAYWAAGVALFKTVPAANEFSVSAPASGAITAGATTALSVSTAVTSGQAQPVALSVAGLPAGVSASFNPATVTAGQSSTLSLSSALSTAAGTTTLTITGTGTSTSHSAPVALTVTSPANEFSVSAPASGAITAGATTALSVSTAVTSGQAQPVALSVAGLPAGVSASFNPATVTAGQSSTLSLSSALSTAAGTTTLTITGTGTSTSHSAPVALTVTSPANEFSVSAPASGAITAGATTALSVSTAVTSGQAQPVALSVAGLPAGVSASFNPATVTAGQSSTLSLSSALSTAAGTTTLTITGTGTSTSHSAPVALTVTSPATIRAAFYYPWFPQTWGSDPQNPFTNYVPTLGRYSTDLPTVKTQIADMQFAGVSLGLASWFGQGSNTNANWPVLFQAAQGTGFSWAPYYESEGTSDPAPAAIAADLHYLRTTYGGGSALAMLPGRGMPVFVYNADDLDNAHGCATVTRWKQAKDLLLQQYAETVYVDLKVFPGYTTCADGASIGGWHQYGPASATQDFSHAPGDGSFAISPGFWKAGIAYGTAPFLARDRARWQSNIATMNASGAKWQLITTYNEWGEGTAIESSSGCRVTPPPGTYCDWSAGGTTSEPITDLHNAPPP